jgi:hypothetical protein
VTVLSLEQVAQQEGVSRDLVDRLVSPIRWGGPWMRSSTWCERSGTRVRPRRIGPAGDDPSIFELMQIGSRFLDQ